MPLLLQTSTSASNSKSTNATVFKSEVESADNEAGSATEDQMSPERVKRLFKIRFLNYFKQLTEGCGRNCCRFAKCASAGLHMRKEEAAAEALRALKA